MGGPELTFPDAFEGFRGHLRACGWPRAVTFVPFEHVLTLPHNRALLFRQPPEGDVSSGESAFDLARVEQVPAELHGLSHDGNSTLATVRIIRELAQGEAMFVQGGLKITTALPAHRISRDRSGLVWRFSAWVEARRMRRVLKALARAA